MGDNNKSSISLVIETIICVLLVGVLIFGGILVYKNSNNSSNNTNSIAQTDNNNEKVKDKTEDEEDKPSTTVNITNNTHQEVINPDSSPKTVINHVVTPSSPQVTSFGIGDIYLSDVYSFLSLRSASSTSSSCIVKLAPCTELVILKNSTNNMVYVRVNEGLYSGYTGYVSASYITKRGYGLQRGSINSSYYYVSGVKEYLPIRSIPEIDDRYLIGKVYNGDNVMLLEKTNNKFWKVKDVDHNVVGYVVADYLTK